MSLFGLLDLKKSLFNSKLDLFGNKSGSLLSYKDGGAVVGRGDVKHGDEDALTHGLDGSFQFMRPGFQKLSGHTDKDIFVVDAPSSQYTVNAHHSSVSVIGNCTWDTLIGFEYVKFSDKLLNLKTGELEELPKFDPMDASISGTAFIDVNKDGIDNDGKDLAHGKVLLLDKNYHKIAETKTDAHGNYSFDGLAEGDYIIDFEFGPYTQKNVGQDDSIDSDVHSSSGRSDVISLGKSEAVDIDAGVLRDIAPTPTPTPTPPSGDECRVEDAEGTTQQLKGSDDKLDIFVVKGEKDDYGWGPTEDGQGIVIWSAKGFDILFDFDKIEFTDVILDIATGTTTPNTGYTPAPTPAPQPPHVDILIENKADQNETIIGTDAMETYVIDADKSDYGIAKTDDGGFVVYSQNEFDLLYDIEEIQFNDQTIILDDYA